MISGKKVVVIIPSRYGSKRFEGKPLAAISGKPMIQWVYESALKADYIKKVYVATDDDRIYHAVEKFGGKAVMTSPKNRSGTDRVAEAAGIIGLKADDIVVNIQGDQPLVDSRCFDQVVKPFFHDNELEMSTLAFAIEEKREIIDPKDVKVVFDTHGWALYFSRSTIPYDRDGLDSFDTYKHLGVYAYRKSFLDTFTRLPTGKLEMIEKLEQLRAMEYGHRVLVVVTPYDSPEVDLPEDIIRIEGKMGRL